MANILSLHQRSVILPASADYARLRVFLSGTETQVTVYSDPGLSVPLFQPIDSDADGVFPALFVEGGAALRLLVTDDGDVPLPGYAMDWITPSPADATGAAQISFTPTETVPALNVQDAIEMVAAMAEASGGSSSLSMTPWVTGGSGDAFQITPTPAITGYAVGQTWLVRPNRNNSGASTLEVNGLGTRQLQKIGPAMTPVALGVNEIKAGREFMVYYDGTRMLMTLGRSNDDRGSGTNGFFARFGDYQVCMGLIELVSPGGTNAAGSWTYPAPFNGQPPWVHGTVAPSDWTKSSTTVVDDAGIGIDAMGPVIPGPASSTAATFRVYRQQGTANFPANGSLWCRTIAIGRWQ